MDLFSLSFEFFAGILVLVTILEGISPSVYMLQIIYYSFCTFMITLALIYATSSVVIFFKDLQQIIIIVLQLGMWATPIMWNINDQSEKIQMIMKINPLCYIVDGYRNSIYGGKFFWEEGWYNLYFWGITIVLFIIGTKIFTKLKVHFADVM